jgi:cytochrome c-type biogenesis protein CcmH/NrfF
MTGTKSKHKRVVQFKSNQEIMNTLDQSYTDIVQPAPPVKEQATDIPPPEEPLSQDEE